MWKQKRVIYHKVNIRKHIFIIRLSFSYDYYRSLKIIIGIYEDRILDLKEAIYEMYVYILKIEKNLHEVLCHEDSLRLNMYIQCDRMKGQ